MKKIFWIAAAVAGVFTAASCQKNPALDVTDGDGVVTLTVKMPEILETKADMSISQAENADILYYEIWNSDWSQQLYPKDGELASADVVNKEATIEVSLITDQIYNFIFWAQDKNHDAYDVTDLQNIGIDYSVIAADGNQDKYDAYYSVERFDVKGSIKETVPLYRPFAQLNFGASKMTSLFGDIVVNRSEITVEGLAPTFSTRDGIGTGTPQTVTFVADGKVQTSELLATNHTTYTWIAMDYMLMTDDQCNVDVTATFDVGMKAPVLHEITNVPLRKNYRTNIIGDLFTADAHLDVVIDPAFEKPDYDVFAALHEGGLITLYGDILLYPENPMIAVAGPEKPIVIDLNGYSIKTIDGQSVYRPGEVSALISVQNGSVVTIKGEGLVDGGAEDYAVEVRGGTLNIEGGEYVGAYTAAYASEGTINISGGRFSDSLNDNTYVLNLSDANGKNGTAKILATGGTYVGFNPENNAAENPQVNFCAPGYNAVDNGDGTYTVDLDIDYEFDANTYYVYNADGLAKWAYHVTYIDNTTNVYFKRNIVLPAREIEIDAANETYTFTGDPITVSGGVPSGSNWITAGMLDNNLPYFEGTIEGNGKALRGLRMNSTSSFTSFIGVLYGGKGEGEPDMNMDAVAINNFSLNDAVIYSTASYTAGIVCYSQNAKSISNCHVYNSTITGATKTAAIAAHFYTRESDTYSVMSDCSTDVNTTVTGSSEVGGLVGYQYGSVILHSVNAAKVSGTSNVGGISGYTRDYWNYRNAYIIACGNTGDVTASGNYAGGITSQLLRDSSSHPNSEAGVIACWSTAESLSAAASKGLLVGKTTNTDLIYGSWAVKVSGLSKVVGTGSSTACYAFDSVSDITSADVDAMNAAIADYNSTRAGHQSYCPYTWVLTAGVPELVM